MQTVLISGAGVAGPTLAYWLARSGFRPTVVELAPAHRSSGHPVDVLGPAWPVAERMGIVPRLREAATSAKAMRLLDREGRDRGRVPMSAGRSGPTAEVPRADLATILYEAARDDAEFVFDDTITAMTQDGSGVDVTFQRSAPRRFDLVVGADGLHSTVRRLAFGPASQFVRHLGVYVGGMPLGHPSDHPDEVLLHNTPRHLIAVHPARGNALVAFIFWRPELPRFDYRDMEQHREMILSAYADQHAWRTPELLDRVRTAPDLYFDSVSKVVLPSWSRGRVTLLGDAASSVSLFGDGSSMAIAGADTLATALTGNTDIDAALLRYEHEHRRRTDTRSRTARLTASLLVPQTSFGIAARNAAARLLLSRG